MPTTSIHSNRETHVASNGPDSSQKTDFIFDTWLSRTQSRKIEQLPSYKIGTLNPIKNNFGSISFWGIILLLSSAAIILFCLHQILKSNKDLQHMQALFSCAYGHSLLLRSKIERIHGMTKKIMMMRKAELASKLIPLPASQATAKTLEVSRLILEKYQNGFIQMTQSDLMKYQISSCRKIKWVHGPPLGLSGFKINRDPLLRYPLLKQSWSTCIQHYGHWLRMDQKQSPYLSMKSIYGAPCF